MQTYMLVMSGAQAQWKGLSPDENQKIMEKYYAFVEMLKTKHGFAGGSALNQAGYSLKTVDRSVQVDGPFPETKEVLNGYMLFQAPSIAEAVELAKQCPALLHGETVQVFEYSQH